MVLKIFPALREKLPWEIWIAVTAIVLIRLFSYVATALKYRRFTSLHTKLNKITGFVVFMIPYMINLSVAVPYCVTACGVSAVSSLEQLLIHIKMISIWEKEK